MADRFCYSSGLIISKCPAHSRTHYIHHVLDPSNNLALPASLHRPGHSAPLSQVSWSSSLVLASLSPQKTSEAVVRAREGSLANTVQNPMKSEMQASPVHKEILGPFPQRHTRDSQDEVHILGGCPRRMVTDSMVHRHTQGQLWTATPFLSPNIPCYCKATPYFRSLAMF